MVSLVPKRSETTWRTGALWFFRPREIWLHKNGQPPFVDLSRFCRNLFKHGMTRRYLQLTNEHFCRNCLYDSLMAYEPREQASNSALRRMTCPLLSAFGFCAIAGTATCDLAEICPDETAQILESFWNTKSADHFHPGLFHLFAPQLWFAREEEPCFISPI